MKKRPFLIFMAIVGVLVTFAIVYIQSPHFASLVKKIVAQNLPGDLGIDGDFSEFAIKLVPPGISIKKPKVTVRKKNILNMPAGSAVTAERIDLNFRLFQMFSRNIRVHEVLVVNGDVQLSFDQASLAKKPSKKSMKIGFNWDELLQIRADAISIKNTHLRLDSTSSDLALDFVADSLRVEQAISTLGPAYEISLTIKDYEAVYPKEWKVPPSFAKLERLRASAYVNATGVKLDEIYLSSAGLEATASGNIVGNILANGSLTIETKLDFQGELGQILRIAQNQKLEAEGQVSFSGKMKASLDRFVETLRAEGTVQGKGMRYQKWRADQLKIDGAWSAAGKGGDLSISKILISRKEVARVGGNQPGDGGKVEVGPIKVSFPMTEPLTVPVHFTKAHVHWLGAPALVDVYPLSFRLNGPLHVTYVPGKPSRGQSWEAQVKLQLSADDFQLDNQRLGRVKPLRKVLSIPRIALEGPIIVDSTGVRPVGVMLSLPNTKFRMGGKIDFKTGYDLHASGSVDLKDIGQIAENDILGKGTLEAHIHGPSARVLVDFDADVADAYYLRLNLGNLKGRITWDDDPQKVLFSKVELSKGRTSYMANGVLAVGQKEHVALNFQVPEGDIRDFIRIFDVLVADLWWFPRTLSGPVKGEIKVAGGLAFEELDIAAKMGGTNWEFLGERIKQITLQGGYDRGKYYISDVKGTKRSGRFQGRIAFDNDRKFDWDFKTQEMMVGDLDHIARLDVPMRGKLAVASSGQGKEGSIESDTQMSLTDFSVRGVSMPASQMNIKMHAGVITLNASALGGQGLLDVAYNWNPSAKSTIKAELRHLDFSPVLFLLNSKLIQDPVVSGFISGEVNLSFNAGKIEFASGKLDLSEYLLQKAGTSFQLQSPVSVKVSEGSFDLKELAIRSNAGNAVVSLRGRSAQLEGQISGEADVSAVEFFTSSISKASGPADLDFALGGTIKEPTIFGRATLKNVSVRVPSVESLFENVGGVFQLRQNILNIQGIEGDLAGGRVKGEGRVVIFADRYPHVSIRGNLLGNKLKVYPFQFVRVSGGIHVHGEDLPYAVDGKITVLSALSKEKIFNQRQSEMLKAMKYTPPASSKKDSNYARFKLNVHVVADHGIIVQNDLFDAEMKANVTLVNTLEAPRLLGTAELIQGKIIFKGHTFQIHSASANFDSPTVINPAFNLTATTETNNTKIQLYVSGRMMDPLKIDLSSTPVMPESEILSLLILGLSPSEYMRLSPADQSSVGQGEAASLLLNSLDFNREVQNKTGFQIQLDETVNTQQGTSVFRPSAQTDTSAAPRIIIKKRIGKRMNVSGASTVGVGSGSQKEINAEVQVTPGFSVIGVWEDYNAVSTQDNRTSYGMDLKLQKRFK